MSSTEPAPQQRESDASTTLVPRHEAEEPLERGHLIATIIGVLGSLLLFAVVVEVMYLFTHGRTASVAAEEKSPEQKIAERRAEDRAILSSYGVVDKEKGVYRLRIERAMELIAEGQPSTKAEAKAGDEAPPKAEPPAPTPPTEPSP